MRLVSELRRRNVLRMAVLYAVAAWLIVQVAGVLIDLAKLPDWIGTTTLWLLAVGFPIALIFSWFYEITPEGISLEKDVDPDVSITHVTGRRLDFVVISLLCAAVILFAYDKWWMQGPPENSIAVLPFADMSLASDHKYFSDGLAEELLNLLAKVQGLRVTSRTSSFSFADKSVDIPDIAAALNVAYILEGSVRRSGDRLRVTAQLIDTKIDAHVWSETFDRQMADIFDIQDDIAASVVDQLKATLVGETPQMARTDPEAYALILQARYLVKQSTADSLERAEKLYHQALEIDPSYAAAWAGLSGVINTQVMTDLRARQEGWQLSREAAEKAVALDPDYAVAHALLGRLASVIDDDLMTAARHFENALALDSTSTAIIANVSLFLLDLNRLEESILLNEYMVALDPVNPIGHYNLAVKYYYAGRLGEAEASVRKTLTLSPEFLGGQYLLGSILLFRGESELALAAFQEEKDEVWSIKGQALASYALGHESEFTAFFSALKDGWGDDWPAEIAHIYAYTGDLDAAFDWLDKETPGGWGEGRHIRLYDNIRVDERWQVFLETMGVSDSQLAKVKFNPTIPNLN